MTHLTNCGCTQLVFGNAGDRGREWGECPAAKRLAQQSQPPKEAKEWTDFKRMVIRATEIMVKYTSNQTQEDDENGSNS